MAAKNGNDLDATGAEDAESKARDAVENATHYAQSLDAMLAFLARGSDAFRGMDRGSQDGYLLACATMATELRDILEEAAP